MSRNNEFSVKDIWERIDENNFYEVCRNMGMSEEEITSLKFLNLSNEDKYQLVLKYEKEKKTPEEIYRIIKNPTKWMNFAMQRQWNSDSLKFSGNKIKATAKRGIVNTWVTRKLEEGLDEQTAYEQLVWLIDDLSEELFQTEDRIHI